MMESNSIGYLTNLLNSIKEQRLVLFVGSGISIYPPANLPAGGMVTKILKRLLQELDCFDAEEIGDFPGCAKGHKILSKALQGQNQNEEAKEALTKADYYLQELEVKCVDRPPKLDNIIEEITFD